MSDARPSPETLAAGAAPLHDWDDSVGSHYRRCRRCGEPWFIGHRRPPGTCRGPATSAVTPDLNLLRALTGEGGRRTGDLRRAGYLTWQVTPAGYRALGLPATAVVAEHIDSVYGGAPVPVPNPGPPMSREDFRVASERISPTPRFQEEGDMTARERAELAAEDYRKERGGSLEEIIEWALVAHAREAAAAMREAAADAAGKTCTCAAFWADYNRIDPQCGAHDAQETIAALPLPGDPK